MILPAPILAPAKLNLFLHITGQRPDGLHSLESLVAFTAFGDSLEITEGRELTLATEGPFGASLEGSDNIILRAANLLRRYIPSRPGAHMLLRKHIPVAAGLGGGSSDASAALLGLMRLWKLKLKPGELQKIALQLGSDVPACLAREPSWMSGAGETLVPAILHAPVWVVLANPGLPLATAEVFRIFSGDRFDPAVEAPGPIKSFDALIAFLKGRHNALEAPARTLAPVIGEVLAALDITPGCALARMSGSGATCFGLYREEASAMQAARQLQDAYPKWWCMPTQLVTG